jgi:curved DNA-binding protein CbpA
MGRLLNSYLALGIPAGAPLTVALRRYRWLAQAFHPDRFVESRKSAAEQEMRRINDARDILRTHFALKHKSAAEQCACESWAKSAQQPSDSVPKHSSQSSKASAAPASSETSSNSSQTRREKLISDARTSYRKDIERKTTETADENKSTLSQEVWERRYGTYRMNRDQYADRVGSEKPSANSALQAENNEAHAPKGTAQPIVVPQWILVVMALIFFSMAMAVNHHDNLSTQYGSQTIETQ